MTSNDNNRLPFDTNADAISSGFFVGQELGLDVIGQGVCAGDGIGISTPVSL